MSKYDFDSYERELFDTPEMRALQAKYIEKENQNQE